jgi:tetratricopeptide (TPR) repeat protein
MKRHLAVVLIVMGFLGISLQFIPGISELNLMHMKGRQFDLAKIKFEKQFKSGDRSVSVSAPLVDLYTYFGEIDKAIAVIEGFLEAHPRDYEARQMLAKLYWDEQRTDDYLIQLEKLTYQRPTEEGFRELYALYETKARPEKQLRSLSTMVSLYPGKMDDYVTLAYLQASDGNITDALKTLQTLEIRHPASASLDKEELHISLLLDAGKPEQAKGQAIQWLNRSYDATAFARFLDIFKSREHENLSLQLLNNFETPVEQDANLLRLLVELEIQSGKSKDALKRLVRLFRSDRLPHSLAFNLIELLMEQENKAESIIPLTVENQKLAKDVLKKYGDESLAPRPLLAARLMFALKDEAAALSWMQTAESLPLLTIDQQIELASLYASLGKAGQFDTRKIRDRILLELKSPSLPESRKEELVYAMLELKGHKQVLPHLKQLAHRRGGDWVASYEETLLKLGRQQEIIDLWRMRIQQSDLPDEEKRILAFQLLDANNRADAENVFKELAANSPAQSPDMEQLMFLWGPRPGPDARKWLLERIKKSKGNERSEWMKHLIDSGGAKDVMHYARTSPHEKVTDSFFNVYLLGLEKLKTDAEFASATVHILKADKNTDRLFRYGKLAEDREQFEVAQLAYEKMLTLRPDEPQALRQLGRIFFQQSQWQDAQKYLRPLLDKNEQDWEANYFYAEAVFAQGNLPKATPYFQQALKSIGNNPSLNMQMARANSLHRLGRNEEALAVFERLFEERPDDQEIRTRIIAALIESGQFAKAQQLMVSNN